MTIGHSIHKKIMFFFLPDKIILNSIVNGTVTYKPRLLQRHKSAQAHISTLYTVDCRVLVVAM
jgi:hypothetical protein